MPSRFNLLGRDRGGEEAGGEKGGVKSKRRGQILMICATRGLLSIADPINEKSERASERSTYDPERRFAGPGFYARFIVAPRRDRRIFFNVYAFLFFFFFHFYSRPSAIERPDYFARRNGRASRR